jgi:hypothetical protein
VTIQPRRVNGQAARRRVRRMRTTRIDRSRTRPARLLARTRRLQRFLNRLPGEVLD